MLVGIVYEPEDQVKPDEMFAGGLSSFDGGTLLYHTQFQDNYGKDCKKGFFGGKGGSSTSISNEEAIFGGTSFLGSLPKLQTIRY